VSGDLRPEFETCCPACGWTVTLRNYSGTDCHCRCRWPRGLSSGSAAASWLGLRVRIPPRTWMFVSYELRLCHVEVSATGWSLVQGSPREYYVSECDREASVMGRPWPARGCCAMGGGKLSLQSVLM